MNMINGNKIRLRERTLMDARNSYAWQKDPELAYLDAAPALTISFQEYFVDFAGELRFDSSTSHRFAIETLEGEHIGNCGYYDLDLFKEETEVGILIGNRNYWDKSYGTDALTALVDHLFCKMNLKRIHLKTLESNTRAQISFKKSGFTPFGKMMRDGYKFLLMEITPKHWEEKQANTESQRISLPPTG